MLTRAVLGLERCEGGTVVESRGPDASCQSRLGLVWELAWALLGGPGARPSPPGPLSRLVPRGRGVI